MMTLVFVVNSLLLFVLVVYLHGFFLLSFVVFDLLLQCLLVFILQDRDVAGFADLFLPLFPLGKQLFIFRQWVLPIPSVDKLVVEQSFYSLSSQDRVL